MRIEVTNQQNEFQLNETALENFAHWMMEQVQDLAPEFQWSELSLVLTDDSIRALNREYFESDTVTDVISFAYPNEGFEDGDTGEVIVNVCQAWHEGNLRESPDRELALYIAHGCHHLMGAEDDTAEKKQSMLDIEMDWLSGAEAQGQPSVFFAPSDHS